MTPVIFWRGLPILQQLSSFPVQQRHKRRRTSLQLSFRTCPLSGSTSRSLTDGSVRTEPVQEGKMLPASRRWQRVSSIHAQPHQGIEPRFTQGSRSGVEADSRREQPISAEEGSIRRGGRRGIIVVPIYTLPGRSFGSGKGLSATVNRSSALFGTGGERAGPCLGL